MIFGLDGVDAHQRGFMRFGAILFKWTFFISNVSLHPQIIQIQPFSTQMLLISSNIHNFTQQPQNMSSSIQMTLIPWNVHNSTQQPLKSSRLQLKKPYNILNCAQLQSTNSNQHSIASNVHSSITNIQNDTCNFWMCTCTPRMLRIFKSPNLWNANTNRSSKHAQMHLQHEAPQKLLQTLETLKIQSLTN